MITQEIINRNLDHAMENGYPVNTWTVEEIVADLLAYSVDCEDEEDGTALTPLVQTWYDAHRKLGDGETGNAPDC